MSIRALLAGVGVVTAMGVSAQPALAGTVHVANGQASFVATGEAVNDVRVAHRPGKLRFTDLAAPVTAGAGCTAVGANIVACDLPGIESVLVALGPGDDRVIVKAQLHIHAVNIQGGQGRDRIRSQGPAIHALGGLGSDVIHGGPGADTLRGGPGDDSLRPHGGPDLAMGDRGDDVVVGGSSFDLLLGGAGDDNLFGRTGDDVLRGQKGEDIVIDLHGTDRLYGGADEDYLNTKDGVAGDYENAGPGPDYGCAASPFPGDVLVGCDEDAGPCCIVGRTPSGEVAFAIALRREIGASMRPR